AVPSTTIVQGKLAIRAAIVNHRTTQQDIDIMLHAVLELAQKRTGAKVPHAQGQPLPV
ncbi:MAG: cytochrome D ubiquinol oxidase subunit I, partial [Acetobacter sp.]|nr:cytochrome D ubiquinol oxidase subunit I [Acetobacter sp.]